MMAILNWAVVHIHWSIWLAAAVAILICVYVLHKTIGWRNILILGAILLLGVVSVKGVQKGWRLKEQQDLKDAGKAIDRALEARTEQEKLNEDPKHLRDDDGFRRASKRMQP